MWFSVPVFWLPHEPAACRFEGVTRGSDIVMKSLKRVLKRLRAAINGRFRQPTSVRGGLQQPQRVQALPASARTRPRG